MLRLVPGNVLHVYIPVLASPYVLGLLSFT